MILECPFCLATREGEFSEACPPGACSCGTFQPWRVVKQRRAPGFVRLLTSQGWQELRPPYWRERP